MLKKEKSRKENNVKMKNGGWSVRQRENPTELQISARQANNKTGRQTSTQTETNIFDLCSKDRSNKSLCGRRSTWYLSLVRC